MLIYITGTFFAIMFAYIAGNIKRSKQYSAISRLLFPIFFSFLSFFILTWIMAVRYKVGTDYLNYVSFYQHVNLMKKNSVELGFQWFNKVLILFSDNPQIFFVF